MRLLFTPLFSPPYYPTQQPAQPDPTTRDAAARGSFWGALACGAWGSVAPPPFFCGIWRRPACPPPRHKAQPPPPRAWPKLLKKGGQPTTMAANTSFSKNVCLSAVGFFVPPLAVTMKQGVCPTLECGLAAGLCILGWVPGFVYRCGHLPAQAKAKQANEHLTYPHLFLSKPLQPLCDLGTDHSYAHFIPERHGSAAHSKHGLKPPIYIQYAFSRTPPRVGRKRQRRRRRQLPQWQRQPHLLQSLPLSLSLSLPLPAQLKLALQLGAPWAPQARAALPPPPPAAHGFLRPPLAPRLRAPWAPCARGEAQPPPPPAARSLCLRPPPPPLPRPLRPPPAAHGVTAGAPPGACRSWCGRRSASRKGLRLRALRLGAFSSSRGCLR